MSAQALTLLSGVVLLLVFALVGWFQRKGSEPRKPDNQDVAGDREHRL
jgi:hypothetical protein